MSKLPKEFKFVDLSDYGRPVARIISQSLKNTWFTPIHLTVGFIISGLLAVFFILKGAYILAAFFLIFKSILDAADGELARIKNTPSYTGRYLDSIADIILNAIFLLTIWYITDVNFWWTVVAFFGIQLQGTLYNYYYVILRNRYNGDTTSRIFENKTPKALPGESQKNVTILFRLYKTLYGNFDKIIYWLDHKASNGKTLPNFLMTALSIFGLGFQLLMIAILLVAGFKEYIIPYFVITTVLIFGFISIRKAL